MPNFSEILKRIQDIFNKMTFTQRLILGVIVVGIIGSIFFLANFSTKSTYSMLYKSPLSAEEYARVTKKLGEWNVKFETKDDKYILLSDECPEPQYQDEARTGRDHPFQCKRMGIVRHGKIYDYGFRKEYQPSEGSDWGNGQTP